MRMRETATATPEQIHDDLVKLGLLDPPPPKPKFTGKKAWLGECAVITNPPCAVHLKTKRIYSDRAFDKKYGTDSHRVFASKAMRQKGVAHYEGFCFRPGQPDEIKIGDDLFFKLYKPPTITPLDGEPEIFLRHMDYLIPDHASREAALDVLAWKVQHIGEKMMFAVLLVGPNRTGKSWLLDLMNVILGEHNCREVSKKELKRDFNGWINQRILVGFHELYAKGVDVADELKVYITQTRVEVNIKGIEAFKIENYADFFTITNHEDAIPIEVNDGRYFVIRCAEVPMGAAPEPSGERPWTKTPEMESYYKALFDGIGTPDAPGDEARRVYGWLMRRDIKLDGKGIAPDTEARDDMIHAGRSSLDRVLVEAYRDRAGPFVGEVFNISDMMAWLIGEDVASHERTLKAVEQSLKKLGCRPIGTRDASAIRTNEGRKRLWALTPASAKSLAQKLGTAAALYDEGRKVFQRGQARVFGPDDGSEIGL